MLFFVLSYILVGFWLVMPEPSSKSTEVASISNGPVLTESSLDRNKSKIARIDEGVDPKSSANAFHKELSRPSRQTLLEIQLLWLISSGVFFITSTIGLRKLRSWSFWPSITSFGIHMGAQIIFHTIVLFALWSTLSAKLEDVSTATPYLWVVSKTLFGDLSPPVLLIFVVSSCYLAFSGVRQESRRGF
jgi:hypothetical protein